MSKLINAVLLHDDMCISSALDLVSMFAIANPVNFTSTCKFLTSYTVCRTNTDQEAFAWRALRIYISTRPDHASYASPISINMGVVDSLVPSGVTQVLPLHASSKLSRIGMILH
jgi:hypothetical protein